MIFKPADFAYLETQDGPPTPEQLAEIANQLFIERTTPVSADRWAHDLVRDDANWTKEYLGKFPLKARMTVPEPK